MPTQPRTEPFPARHLWLQQATLIVAFGALVLAHAVAPGRSGSPSGAPLVRTVVVVAIAVLAVARSTQAIVATASSDGYRVFRSRHLLVSGALLALTAVGVTCAVVAHGPFGGLFAHGRITGEDVVDFGALVSATICMVGAGAAFSGAWEALHDERHWHLSLRLHRHPDI